MNKFISKEKMSKKAKKRIAAEQRGTWAFSPVTRKIDSKKLYNRKRISRARYDDSTRDSFESCCDHSKARIRTRFLRERVRPGIENAEEVLTVAAFSILPLTFKINP